MSGRAPLGFVLSALAAAALAQQHVGHYEQADIEHGAQLYSQHCITCHGEGGDMMPGVNLRSGRFRYAATDRELANLIRDGIPGTAMTATAYSEAERTALVAYIRNMDRVDLDARALGDPVRGRELFVGKGQCAGCHRVDGEGPRFAPDLSNIGATRPASLLEKVLVDPNAALVPINRPVRIETVDGVVVQGRRLNEDTFTVQIVDERERLRSIDKRSLRAYDVLETGLMPSYENVLTDEERADLLAYLLSLKGSAE